MSIVILHVVDGFMYLSGDKKTTTCIICEDGSLKEKESSITAKKVHKINSRILIGTVGHSIGYQNLLGDIIKENKVNPFYESYSYEELKSFLSSRYSSLKEWLTTDVKNIDVGYQVILCGISNEHSCATIFQYPAKEGCEILSAEFTKNESFIFTHLDKIRQYTDIYLSNVDSNNITYSTIDTAVKKSLKTISLIDNTISEEYDIVTLKKETRKTNE